MSALALDEPFELPGGAQALFTTRAAGNLSLAAGLGHEHGLARRESLCGSLGLRWLCASPQVHGTRVRRVRSAEGQGGQPSAEPADGQATALAGIGATVLAADCVPVVLAAPRTVAAVHAGWRGLADGVLGEGVSAVRELALQDGPLVAAIGPCAGACCYEVGAEVLERFEADGAAVSAGPRAGAGEGVGPYAGAGEGVGPLAAAGRRADAARERKAKLDLRAIARDRLEAAGVDRVIDLDVCTICDERLFSHRREGAAAGRQAAIAWLS